MPILSFSKSKSVPLCAQCVASPIGEAPIEPPDGQDTDLSTNRLLSPPMKPHLKLASHGSSAFVMYVIDVIDAAADTNLDAKGGRGLGIGQEKRTMAWGFTITQGAGGW